ncbi:hypothetical protein FPQ18DRAFT_300559 [Pyronema domesticum]|nr:hypothetical protein FPQ18DRAFT_300559 [Pyronema domesticum]
MTSQAKFLSASHSFASVAPNTSALTLRTKGVDKIELRQKQKPSNIVEHLHASPFVEMIRYTARTGKFRKSTSYKMLYKGQACPTNATSGTEYRCVTRGIDPTGST